MLFNVDGNETLFIWYCLCLGVSSKFEKLKRPTVVIPSPIVTDIILLAFFAHGYLFLPISGIFPVPDIISVPSFFSSQVMVGVNCFGLA